MTAQRPWLDWLVLIALVVVWGSAFAGVTIAVAGWPPAWVAFGRLTVAASTLFILLKLRREPLGGSPRVWLTYAVIGVFGLGMAFLCFSWAATRLPSSVLAICNGVSPVFTALIAHAFIAAERLTKRKSVGVLLGVLGFAALVGPDVAAEGGLAGAGLAEFMALAGAALYAVANVVTKRAPPLGAVPAALLMCSAAAVATGVVALLWHGTPPPPPADAAVAIGLLGLLPTAMGTIGYVWLIRRRGALFTSFSTYLSPLWATLIGVALLAERPGPGDYLALLLIVAGVGVASLPGKTVDRPPRPSPMPAEPATDSPAP